MFTSRHAGEANVPAIILSTAVLILALAAAYYMIAVLPTMNTDDASASSSSSSSTAMTSSVMMNDTASSASRDMTAEEQAAYDACINSANAAHNTRWSAACATRRENQESLYLACVNKGQAETYCASQFPYQDIGENCTLTTAQTNSLNLQFAAAKQACAR